VVNSLNKIIIEEAASAAQLASIRELFLEYAASLEISLCFQDFETELASLPGKYASPSGRLLLGHEADQALGCVAVREFSERVCEMKRLYVRPAGRGQGLGRTLAQAIIVAAREIGYGCMRLDTLSSMESALALYRSLGFHQIPAYYDNPSDRAVFMELALEQTGARISTHELGR
jgi:ribosomal protein S18 acetylase RimI-like enzyme